MSDREGEEKALRCSIAPVLQNTQLNSDDWQHYSVPKKIFNRRGSKRTDSTRVETKVKTNRKRIYTTTEFLN
ncbi:hypothetical protein ANSO36C_43380 [Nostoc cf. commune SO-36]|uniref:Uncharacterized protein n=1 Tax=Nostoc cf. commune SO-36 TaxID=449208 RepID=A0ABN6Q8I8_NOSCO|nr:hypothetical protein ANSO36C_43380 [Nostoc cf. commune SO-36]